MTLVNRVSAFFLIAMAVTLTGFSFFLYWLVQHTLDLQFDAQMQEALHALVAAVEIDGDDIEWKPTDHTHAVGSEEGLEETRWAVIDDRGQLIDHSRNASVDDRSDLLKIASNPEGAPLLHGDWQFIERQLAPQMPKPASERDLGEFASLKLIVARSNAGMAKNLHEFALIIFVLSGTTLVIAAIGGRWYCLKALKPVRDMAARARSAKAGDFFIRLPVGNQQDELSELSVAFNQLFEQLQQAFVRQQHFTGDAAHQLRTPLTVLQGQIDVSLRRPRSVEDYHRTLELLRDQAIEMNQVVEGLLYLARSEGEGIRPAFESGDLGLWLEKLAEQWRPNARWPDFQLTAEPNIRVSTAWPLLGQLVENLIGNAFKYSREGTPVTVNVRRVGADAWIDVEDQGIGISAEDQIAIFEPFFRAASARQSGAPGTGLGLAISARIAEVLKARLDVHSEFGRGSTFRVVLPAESPVHGMPAAVNVPEADAVGTRL